MPHDAQTMRFVCDQNQSRFDFGPTGSVPHFRIPLLLVFSLLFACLQTRSASQTLQSIAVNSSFIGTTAGSDRAIFSNFTKIDILQSSIGLGGQVLLEMDLSNADLVLDIQLSTCRGTDFDSYIAVLNANPINSSAASVLSESANDINCLSGITKASLTTRLSPAMYYVLITGDASEEGNFNLTLTATAVSQAPIPWGLDRIDQRRLPLNGVFDVRPSGESVWIYLLDSGVRASHSEFEGRIHPGFDFVNDQPGKSPDCTGHGTHIAGIIAGKTFGVSRKANIVPIRVFGCNNKAKITSVINAIGWALVDARVQSRENVMVSMMFSASSATSTILNSAVKALIRARIPVIIPAGDNSANTCDYYPASLEEFMSVASTDTLDRRSSFSNFGNCTNIFAPGASILSSWHTSDTATRTASGTAQAAAHMTGIVSNLMDLNKDLTAEMTSNVIESISTLDLVGNVAANESTRFAYVRSVPKYDGDPPQKTRVYLFVVIEVKATSCESAKVPLFQKTFGMLLSMKQSLITSECSGKSPTSVLFRFDEAERRAQAKFALLEKALGEDVASTKRKVGIEFDVVEEPWAVDSSGLVYWGAPSFSETDSISLSTGAMAGIGVGVLFLLCIAATVGYVIYRRMTKLDEIESMEGSADFEKGPVHFNDFDDESGGTSGIRRSFRNVIRGMSFRKSGSTRPRNSVVGMNRMGSFIGGRNEKAGKDLVRMESFGGEAFAGMASMSRSYSNFSSTDASPKSDQADSSRAPSFRGANNTAMLGISPRGPGEEEDADGGARTGSLRMRSVGGEAFALLSQQGGGLKTEENNKGRDADESLSFGDEELAAQRAGERGESFFGGDGAESRSEKPGVTP